MFDFIGDVHGHAAELRKLLEMMDYRHPPRKAFFLGDYIDRGPQVKESVDLIRAMVNAGTAKAIMGNHEFNAILFNTLGKEGYLRPHKIKSFKQHAATITQYHGNQNAYNEMIAWFKTLPLFLETSEYRAMHACWNAESISHLKQVCPSGVLTDEQYLESAIKSNKLYEAVEITCKGMELALPKGSSFHDKDGTERFDIRIKWWENPLGKTYKDMSVVENIEMEPKAFTLPFQSYPENERPVFFGHYWLNGIPKLLKSNICCLDYSVAKGGYLTAYRWNGEKSLTNKNIVYV